MKLNTALTVLWLFCRVLPGSVLLLCGILDEKTFDAGLMVGAGMMLLAAGIAELYKDFKK
ncbi:TPA: hypothetical protein OHQ33_001946 [Escherichia coli]|nr:hypothetical protein [Escherichia coli]